MSIELFIWSTIANSSFTYLSGHLEFAGRQVVRKLKAEAQSGEWISKSHRLTSFFKFIVYILTENVLETAIAVSENADPGQNVETLKENATTSGEVVQEEVKGK